MKMIRGSYLRCQSKIIILRIIFLWIFNVFIQDTFAQNNNLEKFIVSEVIGSSFLDNNLNLCSEYDIVSFIDKKRFFSMNVEIETNCYKANINTCLSEEDSVIIDMYIKKIKRNKYGVMFIKPYRRKTFINGSYVSYIIKVKKKKTKIMETGRGDF